MIPRKPSAILRSDASYLVVGGFGGIGRSVCRWLVDRGAKNLLVVSRSAARKDKVESLQEELRESAEGVKVTGIGCDISNSDQLTAALDAYHHSGGLRIRGIIHGGMILRVSETQVPSEVRPKLTFLGLHPRAYVTRRSQCCAQPQA